MSVDVKKTEQKLAFRFLALIFFSLILCLVVNLSTAYGADDSTNVNEISKVMCNAIDLLTGSIGKSITVVIIISLGIMLLLGKVTWGVAIALAIGIGVIFGSTEFVQLLSGDASFDCKNIVGSTSS
jgi:type IV secretion system protein VirB2